MVAIIDYDAGNIKSVEKAIQFLGEEAVITREAEQILSASHGTNKWQTRQEPMLWI